MATERPVMCKRCRVNPRRERGANSAYRYCADCIEEIGGVAAMRSHQAAYRQAQLAKMYAAEAAKELAKDRAW